MPHPNQLESSPADYLLSKESLEILASLERRLAVNGPEQTTPTRDASALDVATERQNVADVHAEAAAKKLPDMTLREIGQTAMGKGQHAVSVAKEQATARAQQVKQSPRTIAAIEAARGKVATARDTALGTINTARRVYKAATQEAKTPAPRTATPEPAVAAKTAEATAPVTAAAPQPKPKAPVETPVQRLEREISTVIKPEDYTTAIEQAAQGEQVNADTFMNLLDHQGIDRRTANNLVKLMQAQGKLSTDSRRIRLVQEAGQHFLEGNYTVRPPQPTGTLGQRFQELTSAAEKDDARALFSELTFKRRGELESGLEPSSLKLIMSQVKQWETVSEQELREQFNLPEEASARLMQWMARKNLLEQFGAADKPEYRLQPNAEEILQNTIIGGPSERRAKRLPHDKPTPNQTPVAPAAAPAKTTFSRLKRFFSPARLKGNVKHWAHEFRPRQADLLAMGDFVRSLRIWSLNPKHNVFLAYMDNLRRPEDNWLPAPVKPAKPQKQPKQTSSKLTFAETMGWKGVDGEPILNKKQKAQAQKAGRVAVKVLGSYGANHPLMAAEMAKRKRETSQR